MSTITTGATVITPDAVTDYESEREGGNLVHPILGSAESDITLRPARRRKGTLHMVFSTDAASKAAEDAHALPAMFIWSVASPSTLSMTYVVPSGGRVHRAQSATGVWMLDVDYQEVAP